MDLGRGYGGTTLTGRGNSDRDVLSICTEEAGAEATEKPAVVTQVYNRKQRHCEFKARLGYNRKCQ